MPELVALQAERADKNFQIVGIGIDSPDNIRQFAQKNKITYPLLLGGLEGTELSRQFGNESGGLPFTVLITPDGIVRKTYMGRLNLEKVRADLASL
jgi:peroxiredoxin